MKNQVKRVALTAILLGSAALPQIGEACGGRGGGGGGYGGSFGGSFGGIRASISHSYGSASYSSRPMQSHASYASPVYAQPQYSQPVYSQANYAAPSYPQAVNPPLSYAQPGYAQPSSAQPVYFDSQQQQTGASVPAYSQQNFDHPNYASQAQPLAQPQIQPPTNTVQANYNNSSQPQMANVPSSGQPSIGQVGGAPSVLQGQATNVRQTSHGTAVSGQTVQATTANRPVTSPPANVASRSGNETQNAPAGSNSNSLSALQLLTGNSGAPISAATGAGQAGAGQTEGSQGAIPEFSPAPASNPSSPYTGVWIASLPNQATVRLNLQGDGSFTWTANNNGKSSEFSGRFSVSNDQLTLLRNDNQQLGGKLSNLNGSGFNFQSRWFER